MRLCETEFVCVLVSGEIRDGRGTLNHIQLLSCCADGWEAPGMCVSLLREEFQCDVHTQRRAAHKHEPALSSFLEFGKAQTCQWKCLQQSCCTQSHSFQMKMSACSMLIKEFCGGKAGWNDRAIFIENKSQCLRPNQGGHSLGSLNP